MINRNSTSPSGSPVERHIDYVSLNGYNDNLPVLYRNIMFGLPNDLARDAFLWAVERAGEDGMCYRAEGFAREVAFLVATLTPMFDAGARIHGMEQHDPVVMRFCLQRHANWRFGRNQTPSYAMQEKNKE